MSYNRDLQEDKEPLFDSVDTLRAALSVLTRMLEHITFNRERMRMTAGEGFATATDVAEYLVEHGVDFRKAHEIVGKMVRYCLDHQKTLYDLTIADMRQFHPCFEDDVLERIEVVSAVNARVSIGATGREAILKRIKAIGGTKNER